MGRVPEGAFALLRAALLLVGVALSGACPRPIDELELNQPPVARLVLPQLWPAGEPATLDASRSEDPEGGPLSYRVTFGDGTADAEGASTLEHVYAEPASYGVELVATDEQGRDARVQAQIVVVGDEVEGCTCALPCLDDAVCVAGVCALFASSLEDDAPPTFDDELSCP